MSEIKVGQFVCSSKGRDRGRFYLVIEVIDEGSVYLVDGLKRRMENPKRKNKNHLRVMPLASEALAMQWESGQRVSDAEVRRVIAAFQQELEAKTESK